MKRKIIGLFLILTLIASAFISTEKLNAADIQRISFQVLYGQSDARKMADMINEYRAANGNYDDSRAPLRYDYDLEKVAMQRAAEIAVKFDNEKHTRPDGTSYQQTLAEYGFDITPRNILYGENILFGTENSMELDKAFQKLTEEEQTKKIMLGYFTSVGIGHIKMEDKTDFWVQVYSDEGRNYTYVAPIDGTGTATIKVASSLIESIKVENTSGSQTVAVGSTVDAPKYVPTVKFLDSELKKEVVLAPIIFESNDGIVSAADGKMTGLSAGSGTITAEFFDRTYTCSVTVTGSGSATPIPTQSPEPTKSPEPTQSPTPVPTQTPVVTGLKKGDTFSVDGLIYKITSTGKVEVSAPEYDKITKVTIPSTVKYKGVKYTVVKIGDKAFSGCSKLTTVTIGKKVKTIGKSAFYGCSKLSTVKILSKKITKVGSKAFGNIDSKAKITVPSSYLNKYKKLIEKSGLAKTISIVK
ncbi:MAG: leucine-rich repeat protein [Lachnospiraceae bacterium]|nr:leucine-rich repeat protein [Lachnospiraceae bacterium]